MIMDYWYKISQLPSNVTSPWMDLTLPIISGFSSRMREKSWKHANENHISKLCGSILKFELIFASKQWMVNAAQTKWLVSKYFRIVIFSQRWFYKGRIHACVEIFALASLVVCINERTTECPWSAGSNETFTFHRNLTHKLHQITVSQVQID
jgi:hypothetical protein